MFSRFAFFSCGLGLLVAGTSIPANAEFIGQFELGPAGCEDTGKCTLTYDFKYRDPKGEEWQAAANNTTDGATIPDWAQPFIGRPFDKSYIKAAVIHDHYCVRHVRTWRATHRVFYDALMESGLSVAKAKLMYYAVYLGGPKWVELIPGKNCGQNCLFKVDIAIPGVAPVLKKQMLVRAADFDEPGFSAELKDVEKLIEQYGDKADLAFLEKRAEKMKPDDLYYKSGDKIVLGGGLAIE